MTIHQKINAKANALGYWGKELADPKICMNIMKRHYARIDQYLSFLLCYKNQFHRREPRNAGKVSY